jgi:hypothetical protein
MNTSYALLSGIIIFLVLFIYFSIFSVSLRMEKQQEDRELSIKRKPKAWSWRNLIDGKNPNVSLMDLGNHLLIIGIVLLAILIIKNA